MINDQYIDEAIQAAVEGGSFIAVRLEKENPEIVFAMGLTMFINVILAHQPNIRLRDVRTALLHYAEQRMRPS